jgi:hypothetical protein
MARYPNYDCVNEMNYFEIQKKSSILQEVVDYAFVPEPWVKYFNFDIKPIPQNLLNKDPFFVWLSKRYDYFAAILKLDPYVCYTWHKDSRRGVGINMILTPTVRSFCVFADNRDDVVFKIEELKYKPATYYVFNTQTDHTVFNFESTRYILSVEFDLDKYNLTFDDLVKDIKENFALV